MTIYILNPGDGLDVRTFGDRDIVPAYKPPAVLYRVVRPLVGLLEEYKPAFGWIEVDRMTGSAPNKVWEVVDRGRLRVVRGVK